jgi:hypothetical protein
MRIGDTDFCLTKLMLAIVYLGATSCFSWTAEKNEPVLVRELTKDSARPVDLSSDGHYILTIGERRNPERSDLRLSVLAVYETKTGNIVGKPVIEAERKFTAAIFDGPQRVLALKTQYIFPSHSIPALLEWDFVSGNLSERPVQPANGFMPACILNNRQFAGVVHAPDTQRGLFPQELLTVSEENGLRILRQPSAAPSHGPRFHTLATLLGDNCSAWRSGDSILLANTDPGDLHWISIQPAKDPTHCHSFPDEIICGQAVSPDGSLIAIVTTNRDLNKLAEVAEMPAVFLNVLQAQTCKPVHRFLLEFPEKPVWRRYALSRKKYLDNQLFFSQLASRMAISPDKSKLALAYGIYQSSDGTAYYGLYSLSDGRRLATLRGNKNRGGFWQGIKSDEIWASSAPLTGILIFSPDSRMLYAGSKGVFHWDISGLR